MIEEFYGFSAPPFSLSPDARFFYDSPGHRQALAYLRFGLQQGEGFIVITGEIGAGKSTLINRLLDELDRNTTEVAYITTSNVNADDVLRLIAGQFRITPPTPDKAAMLRALESYLIQQRRLGRRALVIIDEAQNLPMGTIEELRMLSNLSVDGQSAIQCFLVGQPQFKSILADPDMEQLRQRVIASYHLDTLNEAETKRYIEHRMQVVGWTGRPEFTDGAISAVYRATLGVPRRINNVCSRLLMHGAIEELDVIDEYAANQILSEMGTEVAESASARPKPASAPQQSAPAATSNPATDQLVVELSGRLQGVERKLTGLERNQEAIAKSVAAMRNLEARVNALEAGDASGTDLSSLNSQIAACIAQLEALDRRMTETLADLPAGAADTGSLEARLSEVENGLRNAAPATDLAQDAEMARLGQSIQKQGEILQDLMTVTMSLLGHGRGDSDQPVGRQIN